MGVISPRSLSYTFPHCLCSLPDTRPSFAAFKQSLKWNRQNYESLECYTDDQSHSHFVASFRHLLCKLQECVRSSTGLSCTILDSLRRCFSRECDGEAGDPVKHKSENTALAGDKTMLSRCNYLSHFFQYHLWLRRWRCENGIACSDVE